MRYDDYADALPYEEELAAQERLRGYDRAAYIEWCDHLSYEDQMEVDPSCQPLHG